MTLLDVVLPFAIVTIVVLVVVAVALIFVHQQAVAAERREREQPDVWPPELPEKHPAPPHPDGGTAQ